MSPEQKSGVLWGRFCCQFLKMKNLYFYIHFHRRVLKAENHCKT